MKKEKPEFIRACEFCEHATALADGKNMLCNKKGVVANEFKCRKFVYDLLKRKPLPPPKITLPSPSDLLIDD